MVFLPVANPKSKHSAVKVHEKAGKEKKILYIAALVCYHAKVSDYKVSDK